MKWPRYYEMIILHHLASCGIVLSTKKELGGVVVTSIIVQYNNVDPTLTNASVENIEDF